MEQTPTTPTVTPETAATPAVETPKEDPASKSFAALARKQRMIQEANTKLKAERSEVESQRAEYLKWKEEQAAPKPKLTPAQLLEQHGMSYEDVTNFYLNDGKETPETKIKEVETKIEKFLREQEESKLQTQENEKKKLADQEQKAIVQVKAQIGEFLKADPENYEMISIYNDEDNSIVNQIYDLMDQAYQTSLSEYEEDPSSGPPKVMSYKDAADLMEKYLEDLYEKGLKAKKIKSKLHPVEAVVAPQSTKSQVIHAPRGETTRTLAPSVAQSSTETKGVMTDAERLKRALAHL